MIGRVVLLITLCWVLGAPQQAVAQHADTLRLTRDIEPVFQATSLVLDAREPGYQGVARIDLVAHRPLDRFRFHAEGIDLLGVSLEGADPITLTIQQQALGIVRVQLAREIAPGAYTLIIEFANDYRSDAASLYRLERDGEWYAFTDFQPTEARKAFPCWDEPEFKIPFQFTLTVPGWHEALANTPIEKNVANGDQRTVTFEKTSPLPSYLVAFATGPFESVAIEGLAVPGRIVTTRGQAGLAKHAANVTPRILAALEGYFGSPYPYSKLDCLAVPDYWWGAMENPGAITFADHILLIPTDASVAQRRRLAGTMSHELAHMWFGDLVTLAWWDDLWLNESFASWLGTKITHQLFPEFESDARSLAGVDEARELDARPSTHAVRGPVAASDNLGQLFDDLAYDKGEAVLGMFEQWLGPEVFRAGVRDFLQTHAWGNATAADLWIALSKASGRDLAPIMSTFLDRPGIPLVTARLMKGGRVALAQSRFQTVEHEPDTETSWRIPVTLKCSDGRRVTSLTVLLDEREKTVELPTGMATAWVYPNAGERGYYRWDVGPHMLRALGEAGPEVLDARERKGVVSNATALLVAGRLAGPVYLEILRRAAGDPNPQVVHEVLIGLDKVRNSLVGDDLADSFALFVRRILAPALDRIGQELRPGEPDAVTDLRPALIRWLADAGRDATLLDHARRLADAYLENPESVEPSLVGTVVRLAGIHGDRERFVRYQERFETTEIPTERVGFLSALAWFENDSLQDEALRYALEGPLRPNEMDDIAREMAGKRPGRENRVWRWLTANYQTLAMRTPPMLHPDFTRFAGGCSAVRIEEARTFFSMPEHNPTGTQQEFEKIAEKVRECVRFRERERAGVAEYLASSARARQAGEAE